MSKKKSKAKNKNWKNSQRGGCLKFSLALFSLCISYVLAQSRLIIDEIRQGEGGPFQSEFIIKNVGATVAKDLSVEVIEPYLEFNQGTKLLSEDKVKFLECTLLDGIVLEPSEKISFEFNCFNTMRIVHVEGIKNAGIKLQFEFNDFINLHHKRDVFLILVAEDNKLVWKQVGSKVWENSRNNIKSQIRKISNPK